MSRKIFAVNFGGLLLLPIFILLKVNPYFLTFLVGLSSSFFLLKKSGGFVTTIVAWNIGFLFIIGSDGFLNYFDIVQSVGLYQSQVASILLNCSYFIINIIYLFFSRNNLSVDKSDNGNLKIIKRFDKQGTINLLIIIIIYGIFVFNILPEALENLSYGRFIRMSQEGEIKHADIQESLIKFVANYGGVILPTLVLHFFLSNRLKLNRRFKFVILCSLPIFLIYVINTTRYFVLFSLGTFSVSYLYYSYKPIKKFTIIFLIGIVAFISASAISALRDTALNSITKNDIENIQFNRTEGTTRYMTMVVDYYSKRNFEWGTSIAPVLLFWVPRNIWQDKPTLFGYWFIRKYEGSSFSQGSIFSAPASYLAEAYSDYGICGVIFISILLPSLFSYLDKRLLEFCDVFTVKKIIFYSAVPLIFFLPRQLNIFLVAFVFIYIILFTVKPFVKSSIIIEQKM